jgi:hypothetical protein
MCELTWSVSPACIGLPESRGGGPLKEIVCAVAAATAIFASTCAGAAILEVHYVGDGADVSWEQSSTPTPTFFVSSETEVPVTNFMGGIPYTDMVYYTLPGGGFETPDISLNLLGPQLFSGSTENPVFSVGSFSLQNFDESDAGVITFSAVPEPSTWAMMLLGFAGLGLAGYRASRRTAVAGA